ncbi:MAG: glycosyltransferase [Alphaproteobacteria bacterium]|nr:glycosyltransferase [Alphaproteobacteria bacterium]
MKVCYLLAEFPRLSETFVMREIAGQIDAGVDVRIISLLRPNAPPPELACELGLMSRVRYLDIPISGGTRVARALFNAGATLLSGQRALVAEGLRFDRYSHMARRLLVLNLLLQWSELDADFDILHAHFGSTGLAGSAIKRCGLTKAKLFTTFHGHDMSRTLVMYGKGLYQPLFEVGDAFLPCSQHWAEDLTHYGAPVEKISVHRCGMDCKSLSYRPRRLDSDEPIRFVGVGRFVEKKGHLDSIRALAELRCRQPSLNVRLDLAGDGPLLAEAQTLVAQLGIGENVVLHGRIEYAQVMSLLDNSHLFVLPSVTAADGDMEGIPYSILEAMATGMPVISTWHSGIPEAVEHGVSGLLAPEGDVACLADHFVSLATASERWEAMGRAGRARVEAEFNLSRQSQRLRDLYGAAMAGDPTL